MKIYTGAEYRRVNDIHWDYSTGTSPEEILLKMIELKKLSNLNNERYNSLGYQMELGFWIEDNQEAVDEAIFRLEGQILEAI